MAASLRRKSSGSHSWASSGAEKGNSSRHSSMSSGRTGSAASNPSLPHMLLDNYANFDVKYAGIVGDIPTDMDPTARTSLLKTMDLGIQNDTVKKVPDDDCDAKMWVNAYSVRVVSKATDEILFCAPVHMIVSVGFVKDDGLNIVGVKIGEVGGNKDLYDLAFLYLNSPEEAELLCRLLAQCFQLVFNEATAALFAKKESEGAAFPRFFQARDSGSAGLGSSGARTVDVGGPSFISGSRTDLNGRRHQRLSSAPTSESDRLSSQAAADEAAQTYIRMLQNLLSMEEMKAFAILMKRWREGSVPFLEFCQKVLELYGQDRKHLLARMRAFVSSADAATFEGFLDQSGVTSDAAADSLASQSPNEESIADINAIRLFPTPALPPQAATTLHPAPPIREEEEEPHRPRDGDGIVRMEIGPNPHGLARF